MGPSEIHSNSITILATLQLYTKHCRTISHPNVALFYGCLVSDSYGAAFLHEHCSRGTLKEVLENTELELDWVFRLSFALDAAGGMAYLHSKKITHGRLSTTTCIITEKWTLKIKGIRSLSHSLAIPGVEKHPVKAPTDNIFLIMSLCDLNKSDHDSHASLLFAHTPMLPQITV